METLSTTSSLTTFQVPKPSKPNHHNNHLKPPPHHHHNHPSTTTKSTISSSFSTLHQKDHFTPLNFHSPKHPSSTTFPTPLKPSTHRNAASGYAAALLDMSQRHDTVLRVVRDVKRLLKVLRNDRVMDFMMDEFVLDIDKGKVVKELLDKGKFEVNFVVLVKLIVDKGKKIGFVDDVLVEFLRVFNQLSSSNNVYQPII
ncbi:hypothetical protein RND81_01G206800 [Saponaria officinalis]|uniref:ATP synthase delta chain n=1 Tax=Saponaria officinalis TaxID=3572 RepID=A0AAW1NIR4_SAPOF